MARGRRPAKIRGVVELGGKWMARYKVGGKDIRKIFDDRQQAIAHLEKMRVLKRAGEPIPVSAKQPMLSQAERTARISDLLLNDLCDQYLAHVQNPNNPERPKDQVNPPQRVAVIKRAFGYRAAASIKPHELKDWLISLGLAAGTLNRYKSTVSAVYTYARERELLETNPCEHVPHFAVSLGNPRWMSESEEDKLRAVIHKWIDETPREHTVTRLLLREHLNEITIGSQTGMRKGNQYALEWRDVDFKLRLITLPDTKSGTPHTVPMTEDVHAALLDQREIQNDLGKVRGADYNSTRLQLDGRVFVIRENREWFNAAKKGAKITDLGWHQLSRHTAGSRLAASGANQKVIQEVLGHATIAMSARYTHLSKGHVAEAMRALNRMSAQ
jgi:integrase